MNSDNDLDLNNSSKMSGECNLGIYASWGPQSAPVKETILEASTRILINACIFSRDIVEKDIPISVNPLRYLMTCFTIAKYEGVALCRCTDKNLVIVTISGLVAIDSQFSEPASDVYVSYNFNLTCCGRSRSSHLILSTG